MGTAVMSLPARALTAQRAGRKAEEDPFGDVPEASRLLQTGVEGYGEQLRPGLLKEIGRTLGGINEIGGLRSGAVPVALGDIASQYGSAVGAYAKQAAGEGLQYGLAAHRQRFEESEARRRRKSALLGSIGKILGAGIGFAVGGPLGAGIGGKLGEGVTSPGEQEDLYQNFAATNPWFHGQ